MTRRLLLFGAVVAAQMSTGCWCVRERIAWRWHNHHPVAGCGPVCNATPAFRIPSPVVAGPVVGAPVYPGPVVGPAPGCVGCTSGFDPGSASYAVPIGGPGVVGAPPIIGAPMPLGAPRIETPAPMPAPAGGAKN